MSKGLEALEKLTNYKCSRMSEKIECKEIIEKQLNDYYSIKNILDDFGLENPQNLIDNLKTINSFEKKLKRLDELEIMYSNCVIEGAKQKKALEIIKKKGIDIDIFIWSNNCGEYNANTRVGIAYTQEEYDLLNEVLL